MTHAIRFHKTGGPEVLQWEEVEVGKPGPGEARVRKGAALHAALATDKAFLILRKGMHAGVDSYSAFVEADGKTTTGLAALLHARGVKRVFACGLATDYCVAFSALDARGRIRILRDRGRLPGDRRQ